MYAQSLIINLNDAKEELNYLKFHFGYFKLENPFKKDCKFLDIGCGEGHLMKYLKTKGINPKGIDMNNVSPYRDLEIFLGDFHSLPFEDDYFDLIWSYGIYCPRYSNNSDKILDEALRVLKPKGKYLIKDADIPENLDKLANSRIIFKMSNYIMLEKDSLISS